MSDNPSKSDTNNEQNEQADQTTYTRRGARFLNKLAGLTAEERATRLKEWKQDRTHARTARAAIIDAEEGNTSVKDLKVLSTAMVRKFLVEEKWGGMCGAIKGYQDELAEISKQLGAEGKKCTGCALNPYRARFAKQLIEDFGDDTVVLDTEIQTIKEALRTTTLQVGIRNGRVHVR
jgi:hypothetical protein